MTEASGFGDERLTFRAGRREDLRDIVRLLADDVLGEQREHAQDPLRDAYGRAFDAIAADSRNDVLVAEQQGHIVATLQLTFIPSLSFQGGERAQIENVRVDRTVQGSGVGAALVRWSIERAQDRGCRLVQLTTNAARLDAHRFYQRLGFIPSHVGMKLDLGEPPG